MVVQAVACSAEFVSVQMTARGNVPSALRPPVVEPRSTDAWKATGVP